MTVALEICLDSVESAIAAQEGGADRIELCDNLLEGGTTPSRGAIETARRHLAIDVNVIIRPRGGDFLYSPVEFEVMRDDVETARACGASGVVIGLLRPDGTVDRERTAELIALARPLSVTFHRAFDMSRDPLAALEDLIDLGIDRVLTSGQAPSVPEGIALISDLVQRAGDRIIIMPGAGITVENARAVVDACGAKEIHVGDPACETIESTMVYRNPKVYMGAPEGRSEYAVERISARKIQTIVNALKE